MAGTPTQIDKEQIKGTPFDATTGHKHSGSEGDAPKIPVNTLDGVNIPDPADGDVLTYDEATGKWVSAAPSGGTGGSGLQPRTTVSLTTDSLASQATDSSKTLAIGKCVSALQIQTSRDAWVRIYSTPAHQTADAARSQSVDPVGEHGVLLEVITTSGNLTLDLNPAAMIFSLDRGQPDNVNVTVKNLDVNEGTITVTLTYVPLEG